MRVRVLSDIHGKLAYVGRACDVLPTPDKIVQIGDFGFKDEWDMAKRAFNPGFLNIIPGNHDDYDVCDQYEGCLRGFGFVPGTGDKVAYVSGAFSIDWQWRHPGKDWWPVQEELSYAELQQAIDWWECHCAGVEFLLTHSAPGEWAKWYYEGILLGKALPSSRTENALDHVLHTAMERHQSLTWIFGHHHVNKTCTAFAPVTLLCMEEGETYDVVV